MAHVVLLGPRPSTEEVLKCLESAGHQVSQATSELVLAQAHGFDVIVRVSDPLPAAEPPAPMDHGAGQLSEYGHIMTSPSRQEAVEGAPQRHLQTYRPGESIQLQPGWFGAITEGCIVLSVLHEDGAEVIIGFLGPGDYLLPHPSDTCHVMPAAMTEVRIEVSPWTETIDHRLYGLALSSRVLRTEAWAAAQAHPYIEQRVLRILNLLAEQFGTPHNGGRLVGVRITHSQLAAITGATRPTITRVLAHLRRKGIIEAVGEGSRQMLCLYMDD